MSLDLFERETEERLSRMTPLERPEPGIWTGFARGSASYTMQGFAKAARAVDLAGAVFPIAQDLITSGTEAQDRYFREHEEVFKRAIDYWTPRPDEVGVAGQMTGTLLSLLPLVITSPGLAVATTQLSVAEDLIEKGVDPVKAQTVGAVYGTGIGLGIWVPIFGKTLSQRLLLGGAGFNVTQGIAMRGAAGEILEGTPAAGEFRAFGGEELTLDILLGLAFGGIAHLSPAMRAQGEEFQNRLEAWRRNLTPEQVAGLAVLRHAQHATGESAPGKPTTPEALERHVTRLRASVEQLAKDEPVNVADLPGAQLEPDPARMDAAARQAAEMNTAAEQLRVEEGLPPPPEVPRGTPRFEDVPRYAPEEQPRAIARAVEQALTDLRVEPEEARANATLWESFFRTASDRYAVSAAKILEQYGPIIRRLGEQEDLPGALAQRPNVGKLPGTPDYVSRAVDTRTVDIEDPMHRGPTAGAEAGELIAYHLTDDPAGFRASLDRGTPLIEGRGSDKYGDLGRGLYLSGIPEYWSGRSMAKWDFLGRLTKEERARIAAKLRQDPNVTGEQRGYYTDSERERVNSYIDRFEEGNDESAGLLANQPYNLNISRASFLKELGIEPGTQPRAVEMRLAGQFAELTRNVSDAEADQLRALGYDGAFVRMSMGTTAQTVVWNNAAVRVTGERQVYLQAGRPRFYSELQRQIEGVEQESAPPEQWKGMVKNLKGVKRAEVQWSGLEEWLDLQRGPVTKQQVQEFLQGNAVRVEEVVLGEPRAGEIETPEITALTDRLSNLGWRWIEADNWEDIRFEAEEGPLRGRPMRVSELDADERVPQPVRDIAHQMAAAEITPEGGRATKFSQWQLPGGQNYRELLITLPEPTVTRTTEPLVANDSLWTMENKTLSLETGIGGERRDVATQEWTARVNDGDYRIVRNPNRVGTDREFVVSGGPNYELQNSGSSTLEGAMLRAQYHLTHPEIMVVGGDERAMRGEIAPTRAPFRGGHFEEPNVLAHVRFNERTDAEDKRVLFVEEFQSDWGQRRLKLLKTARDETLTDSARRAAAEELERMPAGPFVENTEAWVGLGLKRMIAWAVENGFDKIAWTTGEQQTARYTSALRKAVDSIEWQKTEKGIHLIGYKGREIPEESARMRVLQRRDAQGTLTTAGSEELNRLKRIGEQRNKVVDTTEREDALSDAIGKAMAERIIQDPAQSGTISGENLRIDDTGMAAFYDRILPNVANDILKKLGGGKVKETSLPIPKAADERPVVRQIFDAPQFKDMPEATREALQGANDFDDGEAPLYAETQIRVGEMQVDVGVSIGPDGVHVVGSEADFELFIDMPRASARTQGDANAWTIRNWNKPGFWSAMELLNGEWPGLKREAPSAQQGFDITPTMIERAKQGLPLFQAGRGQIQFGERQTVIGLFENADRSTFLHETGHFFLQVTKDLASKAAAPEGALRDWGTLAKWLKIEGGEIPREAHEQFARGFEHYLAEGKAPTEGLRGVFEQFKQWLLAIYHSLTDFDVVLSDDVRAVMDRMLGAPEAGGPVGEARPAGSPPPRARVEPAGPEALTERRERQPSALLRDIRALGGLDQSHFEDITGEKRFGKVKGLPWGVFRPGGRSIDDMARLLAERGWDIPARGTDRGEVAFDTVDEGVQILRDMVASEIQGARAPRLGEEGEVMTAGRAMRTMDDIHTEFTQAETQAAEKFNFNQRDPRYQAEIARIRAQRDSAMIEAMESLDDPLQAEAARVAREKPNLKIRVGEDEQGKPKTVTVREYLEDASRATELAAEDSKLIEIAAACLSGAA